MRIDFDYFKLKHGKHYTSFLYGDQEDKMRKELFLTQYAQIRQHNSGNSSFKQELNKFSDLVTIGKPTVYLYPYVRLYPCPFVYS